MAASSSTPSSRQWKYDVFINFRGEDTRKGFVSHLYRALRQKPVNTFIDPQELRRGDRLSELLTAIRESRLSLVVFSQNYASSTWCLKELVEILKCKDTKNQIVLPIFYEVDPSDVRKLKGRFAEALAQHDHDSNAEMEEVRSWRSALTTATSLSGWDSRNYEEDAKLIEEIVEDVYRKLIHISSTPRKDNGLVDMDSHMQEMHLRLHPDPPGVELDDVRVVGIWSMGGLGKTTIARAVYDEIACQFEACCFLENVKEGFMKHGEQHMQTQILSGISGNKAGSSDIVKNGFQVMLKSLGHKKVLVVVDDVDKLTQIEALLGKELSFGGGSRIIITTRDVQLLSGAHAIELFRLYAFRTNQPTRDYDYLSWHVIEYAQGLPLALKVLGAFLDNKTVREWEYVLEKIRKIPQREIHDVLKTSFDGLDDAEKDIFLDIACFFKGMQKDHATEILDSCGFYPHTGIRVLIDRALITVSKWGELGMHDSLQEMGQEIVRQKYVKEPGRRSRLWSYEDVHHVLTQNTGTEAVESIILDLSNSYEVCLNAETLDLSLCSSLEMFPKILEVMEELQELNLSESKIKELPSSINNLIGLRYLFLKDCKELKSLPSIRMKSLKTLDLSGCSSLEMFPEILEVMEELKKLNLSRSKIKALPSSINNLKGLRYLKLKDCKELKSLPSIRMKSLKTLDLCDCSSLEMFPEILEVMEELLELNLSGSKIKELPSSINNLTGLRYLKLKDCKELKSLPSIRMKSLKTLDLYGCSSLEMFPEILEVMEELREFNLSGSKIKELPSSINNLTGWSSLEMFLEILEVTEELLELNLSGSKIKELPSSINNLTGLRYLKLKDCKELKSLPSIRMKSLKTLDLSGCSSLEMFPEILEVMEELPELNLSGSKIKELPLSINNLIGLRYLYLKDCKELKSLPSIRMKSLKTLDLSGCLSLEMFPEISEVMEELRELNLSGSKIKELPSSINNLTGLRHLDLKDCKELESSKRHSYEISRNPWCFWLLES